MEVQEVFIDTTAWIALANKDDELHPGAVALHQKLLIQNYPLITTDYILTEVANGMSKSCMRESAIGLIEKIRSSKRCIVVHVDETLFEKGWKLYKDRFDKEWSLTDCISFVIMKEKNLQKAFACDHHFEQAGFTILLEIGKHDTYPR